MRASVARDCRGFGWLQQEQYDVLEFLREENRLRLSIATQTGSTYHIFSAVNLSGDVLWRHESSITATNNTVVDDILLEMPFGTSARYFKAVANRP